MLYTFTHGGLDVSGIFIKSLHSNGANLGGKTVGATEQEKPSKNLIENEFYL